jgi:succinate dehydrogenase / fumarate reductase flavoprotein subunit
MILDGKVPAGPLDAKWAHYKDHLKLVNPTNRRKHTIIVVGTGLAGASAAASLGELGYHVLAFTILDSPRRSHSIAAQGGINAAKNYKNDGDSVFRLFYDTIKGGDFRAREANVHRLAEVSVKIIDQCVAQGVPFAREYGGFLDNRSFGGAQLSRTFYARGQTGQQLLIGAYGALMRQVDEGTVSILPRREMLDLVVIDGKARGIVTRNLVTGELERWAGDAVLLATGGYGNLYFLSTNAGNCNVTAAWRCAKRGAYFANPCFVQIHPTCIPAAGEYQSKLTLMSESLRNDGRVWVPKRAGDHRAPQDVPEAERFYFLEERYPSFGNLVPRDVAARNCKTVCEAGQGVGPTGYAVYLDFADAIQRLGASVIRERYGNLFQMYERIVGDDPYRVPMRIYPAVHYTMGGLWVDYDLMSNLPGLFVLGEANFSDHGANRLGASALMQGLADGYFIIPYTLANYVAGTPLGKVSTDHDAFKEAANAVQSRIDRVLRVRGDTSVTAHHRRLGRVMWDKCSISRTAEGIEEARVAVRAQREEFWQNVRVPGEPSNFNKSLEQALRVADYLEFGELVAVDALTRDESCGCHFLEEHATPDGEAQRDDERFAHVAAWEWHGADAPPTLHTEPLHFESVTLTQRNYK